MLGDDIKLRFAGAGDEYIEPKKSTLVDHLVGMLTGKQESAFPLQDETLDSFIDDQLNEGFDLGYQPTQTLILPSLAIQKKVAVNILRENGFTEYEEEYADFFLSFLEKSAPTLNEWLSRLSNSNQSKDAILKVRIELIKGLRNDPEIANVIGGISENPQYLFDENDLSNQAANYLFTELFKKEDVLRAVYDDTVAKQGGASRCVGILPCSVTYSDGTRKNIAFVGMSGYISQLDMSLPLCRLHVTLKHHIDNIRLPFPEMNSELEFRYIEGDSRRFHLLLEQMNRTMSGDAHHALEAASKILPPDATKGCAEKKLVAELSKQYMDKENEGIIEIRVLGETNIQLPHLSHFHAPQIEHPAQIQFEKLTPTGEKEVAEIERLEEVFRIAIDKLKNGLIEKGWEENGLNHLTYPNSAPQRTGGEVKRQAKALQLIDDKNQKLEDLRIRKEGALAKHTQAMFYIQAASNIANNDLEKIFLPFTRIPACQHCQHQKPSYLATILHSAGIDFKGVYQRTLQHKEALMPVASFLNEGVSSSCNMDAACVPLPLPFVPYAVLEQERFDSDSPAAGKPLKISPKRVALARKPMTMKPVALVFN